MEAPDGARTHPGSDPGHREIPHRPRLETALGLDLGGVTRTEHVEGVRGSAGPGTVAFRGEPSVEVAAHEAVHAVRAGHPAAPASGDLRREERLARRIGSAVAQGRPLGALGDELARPGFTGTFHDDELPSAIDEDLVDDARVAFAYSDDLEEVAELLDEAVEPLIDDDQAADMATEVRAIAAMTVDIGEETLGWVDVRNRMMAVLGVDDTMGPSTAVSYGMTLWLDTVALDAAIRLTTRMDPHAELSGAGNLAVDLQTAAEVLTDAESAWQLELDGTMAELRRAREDFQSDPAAGTQIGPLARRALLVDERLRAVRELSTSDPGPLADAVERVEPTLAAIRTEAVTEDATRDYFGDDATLLSPLEVNPGVWEYGAVRTIQPEESFPEATDAASRRWISDLRTHLSAVSADRAALEDAVVPSAPTYDLAEFTEVYRRWNAFRSPAQESLDPTWQLIQQLTYQTDPSGRRTDPFSVAGWGSGMSAVSGGIGRALWVSVFARLLPAEAGITRDFGREVASVPLASTQAPVSSVSGSLRLRSQLTVAGRALSPAGAATERSRSSGETMAEVAVLPPAEQPAAAVEAGLPHAADLPLHGAASAAAQEGWRYLIDVHDPMRSLDDPVAQEARSMPPEVAAWLLARRREIRELRATRIPRSAERVALGEARVRSSGVEEATGTATARYLEGEPSPDTNARIARERARIAALRTGAGVDRTGRGPDPVGEILGRMRNYFTAYFDQPLPVEQRIATVLAISIQDWGMGAEVLATLSPSGLANIAMEVGKQALIFGVFAALGPVGEVLGAGYRGYLSTQGVNEVTAIITLTQLFREMAGVRTFGHARGLGWMAKASESDLVELVEAAVGHVFQRAAGAIGDVITRPPSTAAEAATIARGLGADPAARTAMLDALDARLRELGPDDPDRGGLLAVRDALLAESTAGADPARALPDTTAEPTRAMFAEFEPRTDAERAALRAELPPEIRDVVPVVETILPDGVVARVVYDASSVRIEVARHASPADVRHHVVTAAYLQRFVGARGMVRRLVSRIQAFVTGNPGYGSAGFEARLEIQKLQSIEAELVAEMDRMRREGADPAELEGRLSDIHGQIAEYTDAVRSLEAGRGWIAAGQGAGNLEARRQGLIAPPGYHYRIMSRAPGLVLVKHDGAQTTRYELRRITLAGQRMLWPVDSVTGKIYLANTVEAVGRRTALAMIQERQAQIRAGQAVGASKKEIIRGHMAEAALRYGEQHVEALLGTTPPLATPTSRILDTSVVRHMARARAAAAEAARQGTPLTLTGLDQRLHEFDVAQGATPDYRTTNIGGVELDPARGIGPVPSTRIDVGRNGAAYQATLADLEARGVGEGGGEAVQDRSMVADALHARMAGGVGNATLVTADVRLARSLWVGYSGSPQHAFELARAGRGTPGTPVTFTITVGSRTLTIEYVGN